MYTLQQTTLCMWLAFLATPFPLLDKRCGAKDRRGQTWTFVARRTKEVMPIVF